MYCKKKEKVMENVGHQIKLRKKCALHFETRYYYYYYFYLKFT